MSIKQAGYGKKFLQQAFRASTTKKTPGSSKKSRAFDPEALNQACYRHAAPPAVAGGQLDVGDLRSLLS